MALTALGKGGGDLCDGKRVETQCDTFIMHFLESCGQAEEEFWPLLTLVQARGGQASHSNGITRWMRTHISHN